jgi:hypothetical protein
MSQAIVYRLTGPDIEVTLHRKDKTLEVKSDEHQDGTFDADVDEYPGHGVRATAVLLPSSRNGTRVSLTVLVPEADFPASRAPETADVTGVAIITDDFTNVVGGPPHPALQKYDVRALRGTASDYDPS